MKRFLLLPALLFVFTSAIAGGPWTQQKGKGYFKLSEWWIIFDSHYTDVGSIDPNVTTGIFNTYLYAEYGLTDRLTGIYNGSIFSRNYMNNLVSGTTGETLVPGEALNSLGDMDLGLKYSLTKPGAKWPVAVSGYLGLPTGTAVGGELENLQTGDGEFNQMVQLDFGKGFQLIKGVGSYVSGSVGLNHRTEGFSEEFRFSIEAGLGFFDNRLWVVYRSLGIESFKNGNTAQDINSTSIFANNTEFISSAIEVNAYVTKRLGVSGSVAGAFRGEIIAAAPSYSAGIFYDLSR